MKKKAMLVIWGLLLLFVGYIFGTVSNGYSAARAKTEYRLVPSNIAEREEPISIEKRLNALGADGWEFAGSFTSSLGSYFILKR